MPITKTTERMRQRDSVGKSSLAVRLAEEAAGEEIRNRITMKICREVSDGFRNDRTIIRIPDVQSVLGQLYKLGGTLSDAQSCRRTDRLVLVRGS